MHSLMFAIALVTVVLAMFTVLALAGLPVEAVIALGSAACLSAGELARRLGALSARQRRR